MKVLKFGGTSLGSKEAIIKAKNVIFSNDGQVAIVVSAIGKTTNGLVRMAELASEGDTHYLHLYDELYTKHTRLLFALVGNSHHEKVEGIFKQLRRVCDGVYLLKELTNKSLDFILSTGELLSSNIVFSFFEKEGIDIKLFDSRDHIKTDDTFGGADVNFELTNKLLQDVASDFNKVNIFPGFISSAPGGETTTLGRGGSDYTAAIIASALNSKVLEIWTDVDGLMTADPRIVKNAKIIQEISYEEAIELSHFGAKVLYPPSLKPCFKKNIPIRIKNTFDATQDGTLVSKNAGNDQIVTGITSLKDVSLITLSGTGLLSIPKFTKEFFSILSDHKLGVEFVTQSNAEHTMTIAMTVNNAEIAHQELNYSFKEYIDKNLIDPIAIERNLSILALVGSNMKNQVGISGSMFYVLGRNGVSIKAISQGSSERNISAVIKKEDLSKSLNILHEAFFLFEAKRINLFIIGVGNVGKAFIAQLQSQFSILKKDHLINIKIIGVANSKKMAFDEDGIRLSQWKGKLEDGETFSSIDFREKMIEFNYRNSIFLDITASKEISDLYLKILQKSISVVSPNKIAATELYDKYQELKTTARRYGSQFLIETNVCAGLPILSTLSDIVRSGDRVHHIEAVLSGTLNFLFNEYNGSEPFVEVIERARAEGYTEPDPRLDLSGEDVKRKLLILIRESGYRFEMDGIALEPFMPDSCIDTKNIEDFYEKVLAEEPYFKKVFQKANDKGARLKVVAKYEDGRAMIKLMEIDSDHPFYNLEGKDNIVLFYTDRYKEQPLVIKGAGAGAEVTASGIFADVLRMAQPES
ncbi:MAG: bifunctional aspartate kinase/homoserine dehydrogenase I [Bacteroidota bacterium]